MQAAKLDNDTLIEQLTAVRGIGRWTVEMLLMFRLGRPDVLPVDDFGIRKGYALSFAKKEMPAPRELALRRTLGALSHRRRLVSVACDGYRLSRRVAQPISGN